MTETVTYPGSGLVFVNTYGAGVTAAYRSAIITAENYFQSHYTNSVVLNMSFDLASLDTKFAGQNNYHPAHVDFFTLVNALRAKATSPDDIAATNYLGFMTDPSHGAGFDVPVGMARILGLASAGTGIDDTIVLNSNLSWSYGSDTVGVLEHEISEGAMGRIGGLGIQNNAWGPMDLFRSTLTIGTTTAPVSAYFTFGGTVFTAYEYHNVSDRQDFGDWDHTYGDAFGPYYAGVPASLSDVDLQIMDLLGWTRFYAPTPAGLALSPATDSGTKGDGVTNQSTLVITGTGEAGDTVILKDSWSGPVVTGGAAPAPTPIGYAVVASDGTWSISTSLAIGGVHTLTATEVDTLHGGSLPSSPFLVSVVPATPLPTLTNLALSAASDTGVVGDNITYVTTPVIVGNGGSFGQTVTLYDNGVAVGTGTVGFVSTWSVTSGPLSVGTHKLTATVDDGAGDVSAASAPLTVNIVLSPAPIITPMSANVSANHGQSFAASSLFSASDPNGDAITTYAFWDNGTGGAHFLLNGVAQGTNQEIDVTAAQLSQVSFKSGSGADTLWVRANDGSQWGAWSPSFNVTAPTNHIPNVSAPDFTASHNQNIAVTSLFSVSDADGDSMTAYRFWDSTPDPASGHFVVGGVAQGTNQNIDVTAAQLAGATFRSGSGSDDLWVQAFDGTTWSAWKEFHVNAPVDHAPVLAAPDFSASHNQNIAVTNLFSVSDADGDSMTAYRFWDSTADPASGHFVVGGVAQGTNQNIDVTAAQLAGTTFQSGSGSDDLWVQAFDGTTWSAWKEFHVNAPVDHAPVLAAPDFSASHNQNIAVTSLFSVSDADGDSMTAYRFWDSTADPASGHFVVGGVVQGTNQNIDVTAAQLAGTTFQSGSGSDDLWVQAFDGTTWSAWKEFHVNAPVDHAPVLTAPDLAASHNQNIAASSLFSVSDADGDSITAYRFWDSTTDPASGHFVVGGVVQGTNQSIDVTAAQLAGTTFQSGSGSDDLWVQAFDGTTWSAWKEFHVNAPVDHAPAVAASDFDAAHGVDIALSSLFTANDPEGDTITKYQLWDSTSDPSSGYWVVGGVAQGANQAIDVSAAQLAITGFQTGSGSDDLWIRASDGTFWSDWKEFHVNAPIDNAPVTFGGDFAASPSQTVSASALFSVMDADGDSVRKYQFWDSTADAASGHWSVDGVVQGANTSIDVSASQLASTVFQGGTVSDDLWVRASDGTQWSQWHEFHWLV